MNTTVLFPLGIAKGDAFCNRVKERSRLIHNLKNNRHTLLMSPRRYGKSSLILYSLTEAEYIYTDIDLFVAINAKMVEEQIVTGVKNIINRVNNRSEQIMVIKKEYTQSISSCDEAQAKTASSAYELVCEQRVEPATKSQLERRRVYIKKLKSKRIVGTDGLKVELIPDKDTDTTTTIMESLQLLEEILKKKRKKACFFIDEFQEIGKLDESRGIEGAIRHVAQSTEYLIFIFSGSNRHILENMFHDRSRPLYKLCDTIEIERIHEQDYAPFLNIIAKKTWKNELSPEVLNEIFQKSERHPYYLNVLCSLLWKGNKVPSQADVDRVWHEYILQEKSKTAKELSSLNTTQKRLLICISKGENKDLTGKRILQKLNLSSGSILKAIDYLEQNDYIHRSLDGSFSLIDPLIKSSLILFYPDEI